MSEFLGKELTIYAPVDMTLNSVSYYKNASASVTYQPEQFDWKNLLPLNYEVNSTVIFCSGRRFSTATASTK